VAALGPLMTGAESTASTAPMSHVVPCGRVVPRWSVTAGFGHSVMALPVTASAIPVAVAVGMTLMAGLAGPGRRVGVGPPLFASAPSCGAPTTSFSPAAPKPQAPAVSVRL
jgi:hypothetical protein